MSEKVNIIIPPVLVDLVVEHFRLIFTSEIEMGGFRTSTSSLLLSLLFPYNSTLFLHSSVPLRYIIHETCRKASTVTRFRSQNSSGHKAQASLMSRQPSLVLFLLRLPTYLLISLLRAQCSRGSLDSTYTLLTP